MNQPNTFYKIGTIGIILTIALHIFLSITLTNTSVHTSFAVIYPSWIAFLVIGSTQVKKKEEEQTIDH